MLVVFLVDVYDDYQSDIRFEKYQSELKLEEKQRQENILKNIENSTVKLDYSNDVLSRYVTGGWGNNGFLVTENNAFFNIDSSSLTREQKAKYSDNFFKCTLDFSAGEYHESIEEVIYEIDQSFVMKLIEGFPKKKNLISFFKKFDSLKITCNKTGYLSSYFKVRGYSDLYINLLLHS